MQSFLLPLAKAAKSSKSDAKQFLARVIEDQCSVGRTRSAASEKPSPWVEVAQTDSLHETKYGEAIVPHCKRLQDRIPYSNGLLAASLRLECARPVGVAEARSAAAGNNQRF